MVIRNLKEEDIDQLMQLCAAHAKYEQELYNPKGKKSKLLSGFFPCNQKQAIFCANKTEQQNIKKTQLQQNII